MPNKIEIRSDIEIIDRLQDKFLSVAVRTETTASFRIERIETGFLLNIATTYSDHKKKLFDYFNNTIATVEQDNKGLHVRINSKDIDAFLSRKPAPGGY